MQAQVTQAGPAALQCLCLMQFTPHVCAANPLCCREYLFKNENDPHPGQTPQYPLTIFPPTPIRYICSLKMLYETTHQALCSFCACMYGNA